MDFLDLCPDDTDEVEVLLERWDLSDLLDFLDFLDFFDFFDLRSEPDSEEEELLERCERLALFLFWPRGGETDDER